MTQSDAYLERAGYFDIVPNFRDELFAGSDDLGDFSDDAEEFEKDQLMQDDLIENFVEDEDEDADAETFDDSLDEEDEDAFEDDEEDDLDETLEEDEADENLDTI